ncbi:putative toxin-antitoxin system toxin component, PIN family [Dolichospermum sp. ST_con]|nr:putative toxin-antitoxin system toxin component, PIN family [Dolichospermum sp. ST_con]MDD1421694.1 putative toxin-antitoxin system toxin component, PIN family [Dolichospermum sp. ST_sed1]MDD1427191.1 putative toxin-antitoxin system toxin component, PIN family [Dolichospermum sp. ST_sed9]MDD1431930.1 putative toxin-antitoxin system toxin component, PIN family [Dolichospermum sp. ST_sed6]MDD1435846.1 putative toxin-antitoxin system toxin component, PIN family [Dolichospermum sp. ST_sed10]MDD
MNHKLIVIDTNILISAALSPDGTARKALNKVYKEVKIAQSEETYQELSTRIYKHKFDKYISDAERQEFLDVVNKYSQFIEITSQINICRDADDNKFLDLTQDTNAEFLITGDQDLLSLKVLPEYQNKIITPREFITLD